MALVRIGDIFLAQAAEDNAGPVKAQACQYFRDAIALADGARKANLEQRLDACLKP